MMPLLLGDGADAIHKCEGCPEIGEFKNSGKMVLLDDIPSRNLGVEAFDFRLFERWNAAAARYTLLFRQSHGFSPHHDQRISILKAARLICPTIRNHPRPGPTRRERLPATRCAHTAQ